MTANVAQPRQTADAESNNNWTLTRYVENLTGELTYAGAQVNTGITPSWLVGPNQSRTAGLRFGYYFD